MQYPTVETVSRKAAGRILGLRQNQILDLVEAGILERVSSHPKSRIWFVALLAFLETFRSLE